MKTYQFNLNNDTLELHVEKAKCFARITLFGLATFSVLLPLVIITLLTINGSGLNFGYFILLFVFGVISFIFLRMALWNSYGKEVITFTTTSVHYFADYKWFKDGSKTYEVKSPIVFDFENINEEDQLGTLIIRSNEIINCVTLMPTDQIQELIKELNKRYSPNEN